MTAILSFLKSLFPPSCHGRVVLVGGTVRDLLLGKEGQDIDLVAALSAAEFTALGFRLVEPASAAAIYFTHHPVFGTIEVTPLDSMEGLENDLHRRDFTVNAMAMDLDGTRIDPLGGEADVQMRILRACSDQTFSIDPLRIMRAFRFEVDGWCLALETAALIRTEEWSAAFSAIAVERFTAEMVKALAGTTPERFFQRMIEFGVGAQFLPELFRMPQIPAGPLQHHPEGDLLSHSVQVLQRVAALSAEPLPRFCAFFHDLGKLATDPALYPKHHGHDQAGFGMAVAFCNRLRLPSTYRTALAGVSSLHGKANLWDTLRDATKLAMAEQALKAGIVDILPLVALADKADGQPLAGWDEAIRVAGMSARELGVDQEKLEAMPVKNRTAFILQKRVEALREGGLDKSIFHATTQRRNERL